jgi:hypothetical protein
MNLSPSWEAANSAATQEPPSILWDPKTHYRVHKNHQLVPTPSQINPIHTIISSLSKIHFIIVHPSTSFKEYIYIYTCKTFRTKTVRSTLLRSSQLIAQTPSLRSMFCYMLLVVSHTATCHVWILLLHSATVAVLRLHYYGSWHLIVFWVDINISEENNVSIFSFEMNFVTEDG